MKISKKEVAPTFDITGLTLEQMQLLVAFVGGLVSAGPLYAVMNDGAELLGDERKYFSDVYQVGSGRIERK